MSTIDVQNGSTNGGNNAVPPLGMDKAEVRKRLDDMGRGSRTALAKHLGMEMSAMSRMLSRPSALHVPIAEAIQRFFDLHGLPEGDNLTQRVRYLDAGRDQKQSRLKELPDIPVLGIAVGGAGGDFFMNGDAGDYVRRPAELAGRQGIFALWVKGSSMEPRYFEGELLYLDSVRPPKVGEFVVIELRPNGPHPDKAAFLKRLVGRNDRKVKLEQYSPPKVIEIPTEKVHQIYRVMSVEEVVGGGA